MSTERFVDTHAHLDEPVFDRDRDEVLARAAAAGITRVVNIGFRPGRWESTIRLAQEHPRVSIALGLHPQHAAEFTDRTCDDLARLIRQSGARAVGEIGLDYARDYVSPEHQRHAFRAQLALGCELGLPVVIHQREAAGDSWDMLRTADPDLSVVLHCFDGAPRLAHLGLERGYYFGIGGLMTKAASEHLRAVIAGLPLGQLILETDAPYLTPAGVKERRNEPANIPIIAARVASLLGVDLAEVARQTTANAERVFALSPESLPLTRSSGGFGPQGTDEHGRTDAAPRHE